jgi:hypothetical protein
MQAIKIPDRFLLYWRSILITALIVVIFSLQSCTTNKHGAATPDRVVEQYLLALENRDDNLMLRLVPEKSQAVTAIDSKILKIGGRKIQDRQVSYIKSKPTVWNAKVHGFYLDKTGKHQDFDDLIRLEYQSKGQVKLYGGRWYLALEDRG